MSRLSQFADFPQLFKREAFTHSQEGALYILGGMIVGIILGAVVVAAFFIAGAQ